MLGLRCYRSDIGDYMTRWVLRLPGGWMIRVHHIRRPDEDPDLHDHPFDFASLVVRGWYDEESPPASEVMCVEDRPLAPMIAAWKRRVARRPTGSVAVRRCSPHRISEVSPGGCWTLVFTTPIRRMWGFWTPDGWIPYQQYNTSKPAHPSYRSSVTVTEEG